MPQLLADRRDIDFNLYELLELEKLYELDPYREFSRKLIDRIVTEARSFALKELLPTYADGDRMGLSFDRGEVKVPPSFHRAYRLYCENQWTAPSAPQEYGGQGLPLLASAAVRE